jgi:hypothetical protein
MTFTNTKIINKTKIDPGLGSFGELSVASPYPTAQGYFANGLINEQIFLTGTIGSGSVTIASNTNIVTCSSGLQISGSATISLTRKVKYRPGQLTEARFTAMFDKGEQGIELKAGIGNSKSGYYFGYIGENFGIIHEYGGIPNVVKLTIDSAGNSNENITITLNGQQKTFQINAGGNSSTAASLIAAQNYRNILPGFVAEAQSNNVFFVSEFCNELTGSNLFSTSGATNANVNIISQGKKPIIDFISQSDWNVNPMNNEKKSSILDTTKGNIYTISVQYLGFGNATFSIEDPRIGTPTPVHMIQNANKRDSVILSDPNCGIKFLSFNNGCNSNLSVKSASMATFVKGLVRNELSVKNSLLFSMTHQGAELFLGAIRCDIVNNDIKTDNTIELLSIDCNTNKSASVLVRLKKVKKQNFSTQPRWIKFSENKSLVSYSTVGQISGEVNILTTVMIPRQNCINIPLKDLDISLSSGEIIVITLQSLQTNASSDLTHVSLNWLEL